MANEPAVQQQPLVAMKQALNAPAFMQELTGQNGFKMNVAREVAFAIQHLEKNTYLQKADPQSIQNCVLNVVLTGLSLNPMLNQAHLVPRTVSGKLICVLDPGYQGLITKMVDFGVAKKVIAQVVHENDEFDFDDATETMIIPHRKWHRLGKTDPGAEIGAYAGILGADGQYQYKYLPIQRINQIMVLSESYKASKKDKQNQYKSIWEGDHREEMIKKTCVKYLWKYIPKSEAIELIGKIIEDSNYAHAVSDTVLAENGTEYKPQGGNVAAERVDKVVECTVPIAPKNQPATPEKKASVKLIPEHIVELGAEIGEKYGLPATKKRSIEDRKAVEELVLGAGYDGEEFNAFVAANSKTFKSSKELFEMGDQAAIVNSIKAFNNSLA